MRPSRYYEPIWQLLKKDGYCRLAVHRGLHRRVIKAVSKEKNMDTGYKYQMYEEGKRAELEVKRSNAVLEIKLLHIDIVREEDI